MFFVGEVKVNKRKKEVFRKQNIEVVDIYLDSRTLSSLSSPGLSENISAYIPLRTPLRSCRVQVHETRISRKSWYFC